MRRPLALLLLVALAACDSGGDPDPDPQPDEIVGGVNLTRLFDPPPPTEVAAARATLRARDEGLLDRYTVAVQPAVAAPDGAQLIPYSLRDAGTGDVLVVGLVRLPPRFPGDVAQRPVLLVLPETGREVSTETLDELPILTSERNTYVYAFLAYRGGTVRLPDETVLASPAPDTEPYLADGDDALAFLAAVLDREPLADADRVGAVGLGRGGTVALLTTARRPFADANPYRMVVSLGAPTDFFLSAARSEARRYLRGESTTLPAFAGVGAAVLTPLGAGALSLEAARHALLVRSPARLLAEGSGAGALPFLFVAHGAADPVVPVLHGRAFGQQVGGPEALYVEEENAAHDDLAPVVAASVTSLLAERVRDAR